MKAVGERLRAWREDLKISQDAAGKRAGVSQAAWSDYEAGRKKPQIEQAIRISEITEDSPHHVAVRDWRENDCDRVARMQARKATKPTPKRRVLRKAG